MNVVEIREGVAPHASPTPRVVHRKARPSRGRRAARPRPELLEGRLVLSTVIDGPRFSPATVPYFQQAQFTPEATNPASFGRRIVSSDDGDIFVAAQPYERVDPELRTAGMVRVFSREDGTWTESEVLLPPDGVSYQSFAVDVALSGDGSTLAVASTSTLTPDPNTVYIYTRAGDDWSMTGSVTAPYDYNFMSMDLSRDGDVLALGSPYGDQSIQLDPGWVRIFGRAGGTWSETAMLTVEGVTTHNFFGGAVSLTGDGAVLAVGAAAGPSGELGAAFIYRNPGTGWSDPAVLVPSQGLLYQRGVALSEDGATLLLPAHERVDSGRYRGAVVAFGYDDALASWAQTGVIRPSVDSPSFGRSLAFSGDGATAVVGLNDYFDDEAEDGGLVEPAYVYTRDGAAWGLSATLVPFDARPDDGFGASLAIGGRTIFVGASSPRIEPGTAYAFYRPTGFEVTLDPTSQTATLGTPTTLYAAVSGADDSSVRWQSSLDGGGTWSDVPGADESWYTFMPAAGQVVLYRAAFTQGSETIVTKAAAIQTVEATPVIGITSTANPSPQADELTLRIDVGPSAGNLRMPIGGRLDVYMGNFPIVSTTYTGVPITYTVPRLLFAPGSYLVRAIYSGSDDPNYGSATATIVQGIDKAPVTLERPSVVLEGIYGQPLTVTGRITSDVGEMGNYGLGGWIILSEVGDALGTVYAYDGPGATSIDFSVTTSSLSGGYHALTLLYAGNAYTESAYVDVFVNIAPATSTLEVRPLFDGPISYGEETAFLIRSTYSGGPAPGIINVRVGEWTTTAMTDARGELRVVVPTLAPGGHTLEVERVGSGNFSPADATVGFGVYKAQTTTTVASSAQTSTEGDWLTLTATVSNARGGVAPGSGMMQFYIGGALVYQTPVDPDGVAVLTTNALVPGGYTIAAVYTESEDYQASQSAPISHVVVSQARKTATTLTSTANPSQAGSPLQLVAQVVGTLLPASGSVQFYLGLDPIATVPIDANGRATLDARFDAPGSYLITAVYLGSTGYQTSQSGHLNQVVGPAPAGLRIASRADARVSAAPAVAAAGPIFAAVATSAPTATDPGDRPSVRAQPAPRAEWLSRLARRRGPAVGDVQRDWLAAWSRRGPLS